MGELVCKTWMAKQGCSGWGTVVSRIYRSGPKDNIWLQPQIRPGTEVYMQLFSSHQRCWPGKECGRTWKGRKGQGPRHLLTARPVSVGGMQPLSASEKYGASLAGCRSRKKSLPKTNTTIWLACLCTRFNVVLLHWSVYLRQFLCRPATKTIVFDSLEKIKYCKASCHEVGDLVAVKWVT